MTVLSYANAFPGAPFPAHPAIVQRSVAPSGAAVTNSYGTWTWGAISGTPPNYLVLLNGTNVGSGAGTVMVVDAVGVLWVLSSNNWYWWNGSSYVGPLNIGGPISVVQNYLYPGAVQPKVTSPAVLSYTKGYPGAAFAQHGSGLTTTVQNYLFPGAVQPQPGAAGASFRLFKHRMSGPGRAPPPWF